MMGLVDDLALISIPAFCHLLSEILEPVSSRSTTPRGKKRTKHTRAQRDSPGIVALS